MVEFFARFLARADHPIIVYVLLRAWTDALAGGASGASVLPYSKRIAAIAASLLCGAAAWNEQPPASYGLTRYGTSLFTGDY